MKIAMIGLGKMGANMTQRLIEHGHEVVAFDLSEQARTAAATLGAEPAATLEEVAAKLTGPAGGVGDGAGRRGHQLHHHHPGRPVRDGRCDHRRRQLQLQGDRPAGRAAGRRRASPWSTPAPRAASGA